MNRTTQAGVDRRDDRAKKVADQLDEALDREAESLAERTFEIADLTHLIAEHDEWSLLDCLLDAHRYGTDAAAAWADLRAGLLASLARQMRADLARSRGLS